MISDTILKSYLGYLFKKLLANAIHFFIYLQYN